MGQFNWTPPKDAVPVDDNSTWKPPSDAVPEKKSPDFTHGYKPTPSDVATKNSFDAQENGFDKLQGGSGISPGTKILGVGTSNSGVKLHDDPANPTGFRMPTQVVKPAHVPMSVKPVTNSQDYSDRKAHSWENLGDFVPNTVVGGLQKDASDLLKYMMKEPKKHPEYTANNNVLLDISQKLDAASKEHLDKASQYQLPNTTGGDLASGITGFTPDLLELAMTPEAKIAEIGKVGELLTKYGGKYAPKLANMAGGKFPLLMGAKGLTSGYAEGIDKGMSPYDANKYSLQKMVEEYGKGLLYEGAGKAASKVSDVGKKLLEDKGWMADGKIVSGAQKAILNSTAQAAAFSAVPFITNAVQGKGTSLDELKNNAVFGGVMGLFHGEKPEDNSAADGSAAEVHSRTPLIDLHNFMNADMDAIKFAHTSDATPVDLQMKSAVHADNAFNSDNIDEKQKQVVQSALNGKLASVKGVVNTILKNKDSLISSLDDVGLPDDSKRAIVNKINEVHKNLDPTEQKKTALGTQISNLDTKIQQFSEKTDDPVKNAENEVNLEQAKADREELNNKLKKIIQDEKEKINNGSPINEVRSEGQESIDGRQVAERPEDTSEGSQNVTTPQIDDEKGDGVKQSGEGNTDPDLKDQENVDPKSPKNDEITTKKATDDTKNEEKDADLKGGKDVKKTILTKRAYEGEVQPEVKKYLEEKGLTRKSFSQSERSKQATDFMDKFGDDTAFKAVQSGDVTGGMASSILTQLQIKNNRAMSDLDPESDEYDALAKKNAEVIDYAETKGYQSGEFAGQLAYEYQKADLNYATIKRRIEKTTGKPISKQQDSKIKELTEQNDKLQVQLKEHEDKLISETDKAFNAGKEAVKNETKTQKAKRIADKVRAAKIHRPGIFSAATPASVAWDGAVEVVAKSIETGGKVADAIQAGIDHIKSTDWYKGLSKSKQDEAEREFKLAHNDSAGSTDLEDLQARFVDKKGNKFTPSEAKDIWGYIKEKYINNGTSYRDAISKASEDLGLTWRQVSESIVTPKTKRMSDEMWKKQYDYSRNRNAIKNWIDDQSNSPIKKAYKAVSGSLRGAMVFGHGAIFSGTHAGMTFFDAPNTAKSVKAFLNGWKFAYGNTGKYQMAMEELKNSPNYLIAQRAGLKNDPDRLDAEEYQKSQQYLEKIGMGKVAHSGERGFNAIKVLRQNLFDYHFNRLSASERDDPTVVKSIADLMNLATGATTKKLPGWVNEATFAGGMEAARWQKLLESPVKAANTAIKAITRPNDVTPSEKVFAKVWARRVGTQLAVYMTARAANAAINNWINPDKKEPVLDPADPNWWKFKVPGVNLEVDPTSGMRGTAKFIYDLGKIPFEAPKAGEDRIKTLSKDAGQYAKGKVSPFYTDLSEIYSSRDFTGNVVPWSNEEPSKGHHAMTATEYALSKAPLPISEAAATTYKAAYDNGADKTELSNVWKGIMAGGLSGGTGFRVGEISTTTKPSDKMSTVTLKRADSTDIHIKLTPEQLKKRQDIYHDLKTKVPEGGNATMEQTFQKVYETEYNSPKNKAKRENMKAIWKGKGLSDEWIDKKLKELKKTEKDKFVEKKLIDISGELVTPDVMKTQDKNKFSIK